MKRYDRLQWRTLTDAQRATVRGIYRRWISHSSFKRGSEGWRRNSDAGRLYAAGVVRGMMDAS